MAKRGRPAKSDQELQNDMARLGYSSVLPGLNLAIQELSSLRDRIAGLLTPVGLGVPEIQGIRLEETPAEEDRPRARARGMTDNAKAKLTDFTSYRWRVIREAGLKSRHLPSNAMVHRAEQILAKRRQKAG